jgi:hypothetical protein
MQQQQSKTNKAFVLLEQLKAKGEGSTETATPRKPLTLKIPLKTAKSLVIDSTIILTMYYTLLSVI